MIDINTTLKGRYLIQERIGRGGFATVFKALDETLDRLVAVKVVDYSEDDDSMPKAQDLLKEARAVARHRHPNIIEVYDFGDFENQPFLVMPFADGGTFQQYLRAAGPLTFEQTNHYLQQIAAGLDHAHRVKVIHRDLKPGNFLLFGPDKQHLMISDFGIAKAVSETGMYSSRTRAAGTPRYMAPEQFDGRPVYASDIYALGVILYQMLTGEPPFKGDYTTLREAHLRQPPPPLNWKRRDAPPELTALLQQTLAKDPAQRPKTAGEVAQTFKQIISHFEANSAFYKPTVKAVPPVPAPVTPPKPKTNLLTKLTKRQKGGILAALGAVGLLALGVIMVALFAVIPFKPAATSTPGIGGLTVAATIGPATATNTRILPTATAVIAFTSTPSPTDPIAPTATATPAPTPTLSAELAAISTADDLINKQQWENAIGQLEPVKDSAKEPELTRINNLLKQAYCAYGKQEIQNNGADALKVQTRLENCVKLDGGNDEARGFLDKIKNYRDGVIFAGNKNWGAAVPALEKVYAIDKSFRDTAPVLFDAYLQFIGELVNQTKYTEALSNCNKARAMDVGGDPATVEPVCKQIDNLLNPPPTATPRPTPVPVVDIPPCSRGGSGSNFSAYVSVGTGLNPSAPDEGRGNIIGNVVDKSNRGIAGVVLQARSGSYVFSTVTNGSGFYQFGKNLGKGVWTVSVISVPGKTICASIPTSVQLDGRAAANAGTVSFVETVP